MKSLSKILVLSLILIFSILTYNTYAVDLNLTDPIDGSASSSTGNNSSTASNTNTANSTNSTSNTSASNTTNTSTNTVSDDATTYDGNGNDSTYDETEDTSTNDTLATSTSTTVGTATPSDNGLSISDIINIFVIVIGLILVFLGIAILIKSKQ